MFHWYIASLYISKSFVFILYFRCDGYYKREGKVYTYSSQTVSISIHQQSQVSSV